MKKYLAEGLGTFFLVFGGVGSAVFAGGQIGYLGISLAFGFSLLVMAYVIGPISGCHINPAVTLGLYLSGQLKSREVGGYMLSQVLGAVLASGVVLLIAQGMPGGYSASAAGLAANGFGAHSPAGFGVGSAFLAEMALTFLLVLTVLGATDRNAPVGFAGLVIGLALAVTNLVAIPITNASINPARSIGPAVFVGGWALKELWLFIIAPVVGAVIAAVTYRLVRTPAVKATPVQGELTLEKSKRIA